MNEEWSHETKSIEKDDEGSPVKNMPSEFRTTHFLTAERWNSFQEAFKSESIQLEVWAERVGREGKEFCGKAKCLACHAYSRLQGIQINIGFSGHGSIVRNEFRDQIRKHKQTKKHIKALEIWRENHGNEDLLVKEAPAGSRKRPASQRILKKQLKKKKLEDEKIKMGKVGQSHLHGIFLNEDNKKWVSCSTLDQYKTEYGAATMVDDSIVDKNPEKWFETVHPRTLNFIERYKFEEDEYKPLQVKGSFIHGIDGVYTFAGFHSGKHHYALGCNAIFYCDATKHWNLGNNELDPTRILHSAEGVGNESPPTQGWSDMFGRPSIKITSVNRTIPLKKVKNVVYEGEKFSYATCNLLEKKNLELQLSQPWVRKILGGALPPPPTDPHVILCDDIRVLLPVGCYLTDANYEKVNDAFPGTCMSIELEIGKYLTLSNKLKPTFNNWRFLCRALLTICYRQEEILSHLNRKYSVSQPQYLTLSQIVMPSNPNVLAWEMGKSEVKKKLQTRVFHKVLDTAFDGVKYRWLYLVQYDQGYVEEAEWKTWPEVEKTILKSYDPEEVKILQLYRIYEGDWNEVHKHFDKKIGELKFLYEAYTTKHCSFDNELLGRVQQHGINWDRISREYDATVSRRNDYAMKWVEMMNNTELFWSYWYDSRKLICMIVRAILALDKGQGVDGKQICAWMEKHNPGILLDSVTETLNRAVQSGIVKVSEESTDCVKADEEKSKLLRKCFPAYFGQEKENIAVVRATGQGVDAAETLNVERWKKVRQKKKKWSVEEEKMLLDYVEKNTKNDQVDWDNIGKKAPIGRTRNDMKKKWAAMTASSLSTPSKKRKGNFASDRPAKRQKLNAANEDWLPWQDTAVCLISSFGLKHLCKEINKTEAEVSERWDQIVAGEVDEVKYIYNGVVWDDLEKSFLVQISKDEKTFFFGHFKNPLRAAQCADEVLMRYGHRHFGMYGVSVLKWLNFPQNKAGYIAIPCLATSYLYVSLTGNLAKPWRTDVMDLDDNTSFIHVGDYETAEEAARAGDAKAISLAGIEANMNFHTDEPSPELTNSRKHAVPTFGNRECTLESFPHCLYSQQKKGYYGTNVGRLDNLKTPAAFVHELKKLKGERWLPCKPEDFIFRGVEWDERKKLWHVAVAHEKQTHKCEDCQNLVEAALVHDNKCRELGLPVTCMNFAEGQPVLAIHLLGDLKNLTAQNRHITLENTWSPRKRRGVDDDEADTATERLILETGIARLGYKAGDVCEWSLLLNSLVVLVGLFYHKTTSHDYYSRYQQTWEGVLYDTQGSDVAFLKAPRRIPLCPLHESVMRRFILCGREGVMQDPIKWKQFWIDLKQTKLKCAPAKESDPELLSKEHYS